MEHLAVAARYHLFFFVWLLFLLQREGPASDHKEVFLSVAEINNRGHTLQMLITQQLVFLLYCLYGTPSRFLVQNTYIDVAYDDRTFIAGIMCQKKLYIGLSADQSCHTIAVRDILDSCLRYVGRVLFNTFATDATKRCVDWNGGIATPAVHIFRLHVLRLGLYHTHIILLCLL